MTRLLHPWFSLGFVALFALQILNWLRPMIVDERRQPVDAAHEEYVTNTEKLEPEYVEFFNAGQKLYFWAIVGERRSCFWSPAFRCGSRRRSAASAWPSSYVLHDIAALVMLVGFIIHIYEGTAAQPGTFQSMTRGTVEKRWAWTHHPAWYRRAKP